MMTTRERRVRNRFSWLPLLTSVVMFLVFGFYLYKAQQDYSLEQARANLFNTIFNNNQSAFLVVNEKGLITEWNPAAEEILGWKRDEVLGSDLIFLIADTNVQYHHAELWQRNQVGAKLQGKVLRVKCWMNRKDQEPFRADLAINEVVLRAGVLYTAEIVPDSALLEIEQGTGAEPGPSREDPHPHSSFDPQQQLRQMTGGRQ